MSSTSATPPATRRIARSYLTDLVAVIPAPEGRPYGPLEVTAVVDQLLAHGKPRHVLRSDQLVLTFDLADDPAGWATPEPAAVTGGPAAGTGVPDGAHTRIPGLADGGPVEPTVPLTEIGQG